MWVDVPLVENRSSESEWATEAPDSGYGALVVWCAGADHTLRSHDDMSRHRVVIECVDAAGSRTRAARPRTHWDQEQIEAAINDYLADAGVEARPFGFRWFIAVPRTVDPPDRFWLDLDRSLSTAGLPPAPDPAEMRSAVAALVPRLLRAGAVGPQGASPR